jgi:hypothetical protein
MQASVARFMRSAVLGDSLSRAPRASDIPVTTQATSGAEPPPGGVFPGGANGRISSWARAPITVLLLLGPWKGR